MVSFLFINCEILSFLGLFVFNVGRVYIVSLPITTGSKAEEFLSTPKKNTLLVMSLYIVFASISKSETESVFSIAFSIKFKSWSYSLFLFSFFSLLL